MRALVALLIPLSLVAATGDPQRIEKPKPPPSEFRVAALGDSLPGLLIDLVNKNIKGEIRPRKIAYKAPATAILDDVVIVDPQGKPVAQVAHVEATASLTAILAGRIEISSLKVVEPRLLLEVKNGKLNLAEAFAPKKPSTGDPPDLDVVIEEFTFSKGGLRFRDGENITIVADKVSGSGNVRIRLIESAVRVVVNAIRAESGSIKLKELDVPFRSGQVARVRFRNNRLQIDGVTARVLGDTSVRASGVVGLATKAGALNFTADVVAPPAQWPQRLRAPPFPLPSVTSHVTVKGPFANPVIVATGNAGALTAYDYSLARASFDVRITKDLITLRSTRAHLKQGGSVATRGSITVGNLDLDLDLNLDIDNVALRAALAPVNLSPPPKGTLNGTARITGRVDDRKNPIGITANVSLRRAAAFDLNLPSVLNIDAGVAVYPKRLEIRNARVRNPAKDVVVTTDGTVFLEDKRIALNLQASAVRPLKLVRNLPKEISVGPTTFTGRVEGPFDSVRVTGPVRVARLEAYDVPGRDIVANLRVDKRRLVLERIQGRVAEGNLTGSLNLNLARKSLPLDARIELRNAELASLRMKAIADAGVKGRVDLTKITVLGPAKRPEVSLVVDARELEVQRENLGVAHARLNISLVNITATNVSLRGPVVDVTANTFQYRLADQALEGRLVISKIALDQIAAAKSASLAGRLSGIADVGGTAIAPRVFSRINVDKAATGDIPIGSGPVDLCLRPIASAGNGASPRAACLAVAPARNANAENPVGAKSTASSKDAGLVPLLVQASASLTSMQGALRLRAAYEVESKLTHAVATLRDVEVGPLLAEFAPDIGPLEGVASARATVFGPISALEADVEVLVPNVATVTPRRPAEDDPTTLVDDLRAYQSRGPLRVKARLREGILNATACGLPKSGRVPGTLCGDASSLQVNIAGPLRQDDFAFDFAIKYDVEEAKLERFVSALRTNSLQASAHVDGTARLWRSGEDGNVPAPNFLSGKKPKAKRAKAKKKLRADDDTAGEDPRRLRYRIDARLLKQTLVAPGTPPASLLAPASIHISARNDVALRTPLRYALGDSEVVIKGGLTPDRIDATVDGTIALALLKLAPDSVSGASGTAVAHLVFEGPYKPLPRIRGEIIPTPGAIITPRALGKRVQFTEGKILFSGSPDDPLEQKIEAANLSIKIDDGAASLNGDVLVQLPRQAKERIKVSNWNLRASGVGIRLKSGTTFVETAFDASLLGPYENPVLAGSLEVTDGFIREQFELKNFVLTSDPDDPSEPLVETLRPASLENLEFDLAIGVRNFRARADIATFGLDAILVGDLRLTQSARLYAISGAIEVAEGEMRFPNGQFEVEQTRIEFPPASAGLAPKIFLDARADLPSPKNGLESDLPCELKLDGTLDQLKLSLQAPDAPRSVSETDLLKFVLFGVPLTAGDLSADPDAALRAVSSELTSAFSRELEQSIEEEFGAALQLNLFAESTRAGAGLRYEIGNRLDFEGETGVGQSGFAGQVRVRLLLFDHLPGLLGEEAAIEGEIKTAGSVAADATRGELRLTWRVFER